MSFLKTFVICRHAKADYPIGVTDIDRPLKERGRRDAKTLGKLLNEHEFYPELILSSPAKRARETAEIVAEEIGYEDDIVVQREIYFDGKPEINALLQSLSADVHKVMLFGHNPVITELTQFWLQAQHLYDLPTCAMVCFESRAVEWSQISPYNTSLRWLLVPRLSRKNDD